MPPKTGKNRTNKAMGECAYIDGVTSDLYNSCHIKINKMTAGTYVIFYTCEFKRNELCRRLNTVLHCPCAGHAHNYDMKRLSAKKFGPSFLNHLERKNLERSFK